MKSKLIEVQRQNVNLTIHPFAIQACKVSDEYMRHWSVTSLSAWEVELILRQSEVWVVPKGKKYQIFSGFEIRRLAELHQVKQLKIRIFENISEQAILDFSFSFLSLIKLYMPQTKYGIGSLFTLLKKSGCGEVMNTYLGGNSDTVLHGAKAFQLSHKEMRTQIRHSKKGGK